MTNYRVIASDEIQNVPETCDQQEAILVGAVSNGDAVLINVGVPNNRDCKSLLPQVAPTRSPRRCAPRDDGSVYLDKN